MPVTNIGLTIAEGTATITAQSAMVGGVFAHTITPQHAVASGLAAEAVAPADVPVAIARATEHLAADPILARALIETLRRTVLDPSAWDQAIKIERARQMWSLSRPRPHAIKHPGKES